MEADPNEEDSTMEDATINADTPQTSLAASDSQCSSQESTRAPTPTDSRIKDAAINNNLAFKNLEHDDVADDVTMKDVDQKVTSPTKALDEFGASQSFSWPSNTIFDPGSSLGKAGQREWKTVDHDTEPEIFEGQVQTDDMYPPNEYRP